MVRTTFASVLVCALLAGLTLVLAGCGGGGNFRDQDGYYVNPTPTPVAINQG